MLLLRILAFFVEYRLIRTVVRGLGLPVDPEVVMTKAELALLRARLDALVPRVPLREPVAAHRRLRRHLEGLALVLGDAGRYQRRRLAKDDHDFAPPIRAATAALPAYYVRNYHYQTDGYFSRDSARRYDLQLEIVFLGLGRLIRHTGAAELTRFLPQDAPLAILEIGAGTGELGAMLAALYPRARVLLTDPSVAYVRYAREKFRHLQVREHPTFLEDLSFLEPASQDVLASAFVFHEIPPAETTRGCAEAARVVKKGGYVLLIDSAQDHDGRENAFALDAFANAFYEPYYPEYRAGNVEDELVRAGFTIVFKRMLLFSKLVIARRV